MTETNVQDASVGERPKTRIRWYKPHTWIIRGVEEGYGFGSRTVTETIQAVTAYPMAVVHGVKETRARFAAASDYEKHIMRWTTFAWLLVIVLGVGLFRLLPNGFTATVVILLSAAFFFRGKRDFVREQVVAFFPAVGEGQQVSPLTLELAAVRLEEVEGAIRAWKSLPKTERLGSSATVLLRCLEALSRDLNEVSAATSNGRDTEATQKTGSESPQAAERAEASRGESE